MRIPLLHADFEHGSFTKLAKAVRKTWPQGDLSLMQAQNVLAKLLGYNNLHDAQREATGAFTTEDGSLSLARVARDIAWRMFLKFDIDLLTARKLTGSLHLEELAMSSISQESLMRRQEAKLQADMQARGMPYFFRDEYWDYINYKEAWPSQTPALLERGIPRHKWAIYANTSYPDQYPLVFLWSALVDQIEMLPEGYADELRQEGKFGKASDAELTFITEALLPVAKRPLHEALLTGDLDPDGDSRLPWKVRWIVTNEIEVLGRCIIAEELGGIVPRVFSIDGDEVYRRIADLLCWRAVEPQFANEAAKNVDQSLWLVSQHQLQNLKQQGPKGIQYLFDSDKLPDSIKLCNGKDGYRFADLRQFREMAQV